MTLGTFLSPRLNQLFTNNKCNLKLAHPVDILIEHPNTMSLNLEPVRTTTAPPNKQILPPSEDWVCLDKPTLKCRYKFLNVYLRLGSEVRSQLVELESDFRLLLAKPCPKYYLNQTAVDVYIGSVVNHPNLLSILDMTQDPVNNNIVLITEFCSRDLLSVVQYEALSLMEISLFSKQLILGLNYLHENGFAHRDLKLENIYVTSNKILKITEFGCGHISYENIDNNCTGLVGSLPYIAPEILSGQCYNPFISDMWSLGIIIFLLCSGRFPWTVAQSSINPRSVHFETYLKNPSGTLLNWKIPSQFIPLLTHLLHPTPSLRLNSAQAMMEVDRIVSSLL